MARKSKIPCAGPFTVEEREQCIRALRGGYEVLDDEVARRFGTTTRKLNQVVRAHESEFKEFAYRMHRDDWRIIRRELRRKDHEKGGKVKAPIVYFDGSFGLIGGLLRTMRALVVREKEWVEMGMYPPPGLEW